MRRSICLVLVIAGLVATIAGGSRIAVADGASGGKIRVSLPDGYCALSWFHPREVFRLIEQKFESRKHNFRMHAYFAECRQLHRWRGGPIRLTNVGYLGELEDPDMLAKASPGEIVDGLSTKGESAILETAMLRLEQGEKKIELGVVRKSESAVYIAAVRRKSKVGDELRTSIIVTGFTVVSGRLIFLLLDVTYEDERSLEQLLNMQSSLLRDIRRINGKGPDGDLWMPVM